MAIEEGSRGPELCVLGDFAWDVLIRTNTELLRGGDTFGEVPPATNRLVDATGAGDSFAGAFLAKYLTGWSPIDAARFATEISAWVIEHPGARPKAGPRLRATLARR